MQINISTPILSVEEPTKGDWIISGFAGTDATDMEGDIITRSAWEGAQNDVLHYRTILFNHNMDRPIGKVLARTMMTVAEAIEKIPNGKEKYRYMPEEQKSSYGLYIQWKLSETEGDLWKKINEGIVSRHSVRMIVDEYEERHDVDPIIMWGMEFYPYKILKMRIPEVSLVSIPANPGAIVVDAEEVEVDYNGKMLSVGEGLRSRFPLVCGKTLLRSRVSMMRAAVSEHTAPKEDKETPWDKSASILALKVWASSDGSGDKDTITWSKYEKGFGWYDESKVEFFDSYKLPHHDVVDGKLKTNYKGIVSAMGALNGARGGVSIPDTDREGVYDHIAKHYEQFGEEAPELKGFEQAEIKETIMDKKTEIELKEVVEIQNNFVTKEDLSTELKKFAVEHIDALSTLLVSTMKPMSDRLETVEKRIKDPMRRKEVERKESTLVNRGTRGYSRVFDGIKIADVDEFSLRDRLTSLIMDNMEVSGHDLDETLGKSFTL